MDLLREHFAELKANKFRLLFSIPGWYINSHVWNVTITVIRDCKAYKRFCQARCGDTVLYQQTRTTNWTRDFQFQKQPRNLKRTS
ncbi:uncharacterized protein LOC120776675 isoform X2 [Bactrocera tryoni]|uniref:uncharacterized protein LOC120776675 isoform X2 n=1 Tax=Bactrocera tryoni TaxID=59916 RepID=UPI001A985D94|nr:uncharacterized protein LOC120776675 isoform X2 [Bactrocera tryoni]